MGLDAVQTEWACKCTAALSGSNLRSHHAPMLSPLGERVLRASCHLDRNHFSLRGCLGWAPTLASPFSRVLATLSFERYESCFHQQLEALTTAPFGTKVRDKDDGEGQP